MANRTIPAHRREQTENLAELPNSSGKTAVVVGVGGVETQIAERARFAGDEGDDRGAARSIRWTG